MTDDRGQSDKDRVAEQAAGWVARLQSNDATDEDHRRFAEWLDRDPAHREAYDEFRKLWGDLKDIPIPPERLKKLRNTRRRAAVSRVAGLAVLFLICTSLYQAGLIDRLRADFYTSVGEVRTITLEDGTRVDLNTDTAIAVDYSETARRVHILRGEAFFDVAKNPLRPFVVADDTLTATAVGTQYGVRTTAGSFRGDVQVEEGRVEVRSGAQQELVEAGYAATLTAQGRVRVQRSDVGDATAWRSGKLIFSGRPLREVLATLERYRHGQILVVDEEAADRKVSGIFDLNDTEGALRELESSLPVSVTRVTGLMVIVRSRTP
jgi:transmembrane sensor